MNRWVVVAASFAVMFGIWNSHAGFGVFLPVLAQEFGWSRGAISVASSLNLLVGGATGIGLGAASDRYGPRVVLSFGALVVGAAYLLASSVNALWHFYIFVGVLTGVGLSSIYPVTTATVSRWFARRRGLAMGIVLAGLNLAYVTGGPLAAFLINAIGWRWAYRLLGGLVWAVAGPASLFMRHPPSDDGAPASRGAPSPGTTVRGALGDRRFWLLAASWGFMGFAYYTVVVHIVSYVKDQGVILEYASLALTVYGLSLITGSLLLGALADRVGTRPTFWFCLALQALTLAAVLTRPPLWVLYLLIFLYGLGAGGSDAAYAKAVSEVFGVRALGAIIGGLAVGWRCGAALGPAVAGFIHDATGAYTIAFGLASLGLATSLLTFTLGTSPRR
jgi:MFS family permease